MRTDRTAKIIIPAYVPFTVLQTLRFIAVSLNPQFVEAGYVMADTASIKKKKKREK